jgi:hypothetical protein
VGSTALRAKVPRRTKREVKRFGPCTPNVGGANPIEEQQLQHTTHPHVVHDVHLGISLLIIIERVPPDRHDRLAGLRVPLHLGPAARQTHYHRLQSAKSSRSVNLFHRSPNGWSLI